MFGEIILGIMMLVIEKIDGRHIKKTHDEIIVIEKKVDEIKKIEERNSIGAKKNDDKNKK